MKTKEEIVNNYLKKKNLKFDDIKNTIEYRFLCIFYDLEKKNKT